VLIKYITVFGEQGFCDNSCNASVLNGDGEGAKGVKNVQKCVTSYMFDRLGIGTGLNICVVKLYNINHLSL
jgi:hypothetical protein